MYAALSLNQNDLRFFGMLAQTAPPVAATPPAPAKPAAPQRAGTTRVAKTPTAKADAPASAPTVLPKPTPAELLAGTPTLIVPSETVDTFVATDYPLLIGTDHDGIVRAIIVAPDTALVPGGLVEQLAEHILSHWPPPPPKGATALKTPPGTEPPPPPPAPPAQPK